MTTPMPVHVVGISGSLRKASYNTRLLQIASEMVPDDMTFQIYDIAPLPMYNPDLEVNGFPPAVEDFRAHLYAADAVVFATPEYNWSITGALKNAIDWASRNERNPAPGTLPPLYGKPYAMMGAGGLAGTARAQLHLRQIAAHLNMHGLNKPDVVISSAGQKFDAEGNLTDANALKFMREQLIALDAWTRLLRGENVKAKV